jgi:hypothetical protein
MDMLVQQKLKRGVIRSNGDIFWSSRNNKEYWVSPEQYLKCKESGKKAREKIKKENKEAMLATARAWYAKNRDHITKTKRTSAKNKRATKEGHIRAIFNSRKSFAKRHDIPFEVTLSDALNLANDYCPVLNIKLNWGVATGKTTSNSPSLDRFNPELGYVVGNIYWISHKANAMKQNATMSEIEALYLWMKQITNSVPAK